jgi:hypothetical protein
MMLCALRPITGRLLVRCWDTKDRVTEVSYALRHGVTKVPRLIGEEGSYKVDSQGSASGNVCRAGVRITGAQE